MVDDPATAKLSRAEALLIAGYRLCQKYGRKPIPREILKEEVVRFGPWQLSSIIPSDFCYNRVNQDPTSLTEPMFLLVEGGYIFLGPCHPYTGSVMWHQKSGEPQEVGFWWNGALSMDRKKDPRG